MKRRRCGVCAVAMSALLVGCGGSNPVKPETGMLRLIATHPLGLSEPSDVTVNETGTILWVVTNHPEKVYQLDLTGNVVKVLNYTGIDLEAIAYDPRDTTLWVAEENLREIIHINRDGNLLSRHLLGLTGETNSGLEGLCFDDQRRLFALNEKRPGLFLGLSDRVAIASVDTITFAADYSGMSYNRQKAAFWIVSDQSKTVYLWNRQLGVLAQQLLPFSKPEGIAFHEGTGRVYIVSDSTDALYVYQYNP